MPKGLGAAGMQAYRWWHAVHKHHHMVHRRPWLQGKGRVGRSAPRCAAATRPLKGWPRAAPPGTLPAAALAPSPCMNRADRFSSTMPSDAAKKASTQLMKCRSPSAAAQREGGAVGGRSCVLAARLLPPHPPASPCKLVRRAMWPAAPQCLPLTRRAAAPAHAPLPLCCAPSHPPPTHTVELIPVPVVLAEVHLLHSPEAGHRLLVELVQPVLPAAGGRAGGREGWAGGWSCATCAGNLRALACRLRGRACGPHARGPPAHLMGSRQNLASFCVRIGSFLSVSDRLSSPASWLQASATRLPPSSG